METNEVRVFVHVAKMGSFGKAAQALRLSKSTVSTKISQLEQRLGVILLQRTTRKLHLTPAGRSYFLECEKALEILANAEVRASLHQKEVRGLLKVTFPAGLAESLLPRILKEFSRSYPAVEVDVLLSDRFIDLVGEGVDLAVRAGVLKDSSLVAKKIATTEFGLFASPQYLKKNGTPSHPRDLPTHYCLPPAFLGKPKLLRKGKEQHEYSGNVMVRANSLPLLKQLTVIGTGLGLLDRLNASDEIASDKLTSVLPGWTVEEHAIYLVYPAQKFLSVKTRAFMEITERVISAASNALK